jgi:hypothetical protein
MIPVRQSTAFETAIGPVLDADGVAVTDCVVGDFKIKKTTGDFAALNGSATLTHVSAGVYDLVLTTSDLGTVGLNCVAIDDTVNACAPLYLQVIEEAVYDAMFAASAAGFLRPTTAGRTLDVTAGGAAGIDWGNIENQASNVYLSDTSILGVDMTFGVTGDIDGNLTGSVGSFAAGSINSTSIADGAITAAKFAANAITASVIANGAIDAATFAADVDAEARSWLGLASANLDTQLGDVPTVAEFEARTLLTAEYGTAANQTTIAGYLDTEVAAILAAVDTEVAAIKAKTDNLPASPAAVGDIPTVSQIWTTALTEAYRATGAQGTAAQLLYELLANLTDFSISGTTKTARKLDGTTAKTYLMNDATNPTSISEAT